MYEEGAYWAWMPPTRSSAREREPPPFEEELTCQERPVQVADGEGARGHEGTVTAVAAETK